MAHAGNAFRNLFRREQGMGMNGSSASDRMERIDLTGMSYNSDFRVSFLLHNSLTIRGINCLMASCIL
jgi:hypothetical protein